MKNSFTPGPWRFMSWGQTISIDHIGLNRQRFGVAHINPRGDSGKGIPCALDIANARLIAAAPDLLQALRDLREAVTDAYKAGRIPAEPFVRAGNVLASAEGREG